MFGEIQSKCLVCDGTGKCVVCEGKMTSTQSFVETRGSWPMKKRRNDTREVDCPICFKTGTCQVCGGKGFIGRTIGPLETQDLQKMKADLLQKKEDNKKVRDLDVEKKEFDEREQKLVKPKQ
jgi:hypothetical protein